MKRPLGRSNVHFSVDKMRLEHLMGKALWILVRVLNSAMLLCSKMEILDVRSRIFT